MLSTHSTSADFTYVKSTASINVQLSTVSFPGTFFADLVAETFLVLAFLAGFPDILVDLYNKTCKRSPMII